MKISSRLFVKETLDAHLRSFLEGLKHNFHLCYLAVGRKVPVGAATHLLGNVRDGFFVEARLLDAVGIEINKCNQLAGAVHNHAFGNELTLIHGSFHFFGIDILPVRAEDHALRAAADEDIAIGVNGSKVAGVQVAILSENCGIGLGIFVVSAADIGTLRLDFSGDVLGIFGIDAHIGTVDCLATGAGGVIDRVFVGK